MVNYYDSASMELFYMWIVILVMCIETQRSRPDPDSMDGCIELNAVDVPEGMVPVDLTVDTGAGVSVGSPEHFPHAPVEESPKKNQTYASACNGIMKNQGQMRPRLLLETGQLGQFTFQATSSAQGPLRKPLLAMSDVNAKNNIGFFDGENSWILTGTEKEKEELRALVKRMSSKLPLHFTNGTYKLRTWQPEPPFGRPGR